MLMYNKKINFKFLEYLYQHCDSKDLHEMHLKNVLNGKEKIINDIDIFILRGKEVLEYMLDNKEYNISNIKYIYYLYTKEKFLDDNLLNNIIKIYDNDINKEVEIYKYIIKNNIFGYYNIELAKILFNYIRIIDNNYPLIFYFELTNKINGLILNDLDFTKELYELKELTNHHNIKHEIIDYDYIYNKLIDNKNKLIKMGINELFIYGSYARKDYNEYSDLDLLCITNNMFYIDKEFIKIILEAMLNIKVELNIKSHDYHKFITNDMNNEKLRVY